MTFADHLPDSAHKGGIESACDQLARTEAPVDHVIEDQVRLGVSEPELVLVRLPFPELGGRRLRTCVL